MSGSAWRRVATPSISSKLRSFGHLQPTGFPSPDVREMASDDSHISQSWATAQLTELAGEVVSSQPDLGKLQLLTAILLQALTEHTAGLANSVSLSESLEAAVHAKKHILGRLFEESLCRDSVAQQDDNEPSHDMVTFLHRPSRQRTGLESSSRAGLESSSRSALETGSKSSGNIMSRSIEHAGQLSRLEQEMVDNDDQGGDVRSEEEVEVMDYSDHFNTDMALQLQSQITDDPALFRVSSSTGERNELCYTCRKCSVLYAWRRHLEMHFAEHRTPDKPFLCHICGKTFTRADHLNRHGLNHKLDFYACQLCGVEFFRPSQLDRHWMNAHEVDNPTSATTSATTFTFDGGAPNDQTEEPTDDLPEGFDFASVSSNDMNELERKALANTLHLSATSQMTSSGGHASRQPAAVDKFRRHLSQTLVHGSKEHSAKPQPSLPCPPKRPLSGTGGNTPSVKHLKTSVQGRRGNSFHTCSICGRVFDRLAHLRRHLRIHSGERPFLCALCNKKYTRGDYLRAHLLSRHNNNRIRCNFCDRMFSTISSLRIHKCPVAAGGKLRAWYLQSTFVDVRIDGRQLQDTATRREALSKSVLVNGCKSESAEVYGTGEEDEEKM